MATNRSGEGEANVRSSSSRRKNEGCYVQERERVQTNTKLMQSATSNNKIKKKENKINKEKFLSFQYHQVYQKQ